MKNRVIILSGILLGALLLAGCGNEDKVVTPLLEQATVMAVSPDQKLNAAQVSTTEQKITDDEKSNMKLDDEKILEACAEWMDSLAGLPPFADIAGIDKVWIVRKYHTQANAFFDKTLYKKYRLDMFY